MSIIRVTCPKCHFSKDVPAEKLPGYSVQATCPNCKNVFEFRKDLSVFLPQPPGDTPLKENPPGLDPPLLASVQPEERSDTSKADVSRKLLPVSDLFLKTWELFKKRWLVMAGIFLATGISCALPPALIGISMAGLSKNSFSAMVIMLMLLGLAVIASFTALCWGIAAAVTAAVNENAGFREAFDGAKSCWISLAWISTLNGFIVGGATLLFIIPGVLTGVWFFAAIYLAVTERIYGMDALLKSKALVKGRFWEVLGRLALVWFAGFLMGMIPFAGWLFTIAMAPFSMLYTVMLYRDLSDTAGDVVWSSSDGTKAGWLILGLAGYLLIPFMIFVLAGAAFFSNFEPLFKMIIKNAQKGQQVQMIIPRTCPEARFCCAAENSADTAMKVWRPEESYRP